MSYSVFTGDVISGQILIALFLTRKKQKKDHIISTAISRPEKVLFFMDDHPSQFAEKPNTGCPPTFAEKNIGL